MQPPGRVIDDEDALLLARIGYKQELRREFTRFSTISYAISILGVLGSVPATLNAPLASGGTGTALLCWGFGSIMAFLVACSVSELVSAYPTAGGMYFVTKHVVPKEKVAIWAWIVGWANFLGQAAGVSSVSYSVAQMLLAGWSMWTFDRPIELGGMFVPSSGQTVALGMGLLVMMGVICSLTTKRLHQVITFFAPINLGATILICISLLVLAPAEQKNSLTQVFTNFTDGSGWGSKLLSFLLGFLAVAWTMTDYDGTTHLSEETHNAAIRGPIAINLAIVVSGIFGFALTLVLCICSGDLEQTLGTKTGMAAAQIFLDVAGSRIGVLLWFFVVLVQFFTGCSAMLANTRMAYAFSRDGGLPFSKTWSRISPITHTPLNAVWLVVGFCLSLLPIALGSTQTIVAIFAITAPALDLSYCAVIIARRAYEHRVEFVPGPYSLGKYGRVINSIAVTWVILISVVLFLPPEYPINRYNMNYAIFVALSIGLFAGGWWYLGAKETYKGPKTKDIERIVEEDEERRRLLVG